MHCSLLWRNILSRFKLLVFFVCCFFLTFTGIRIVFSICHFTWGYILLIVLIYTTMLFGCSWWIWRYPWVDLNTTRLAYWLSRPEYNYIVKPFMYLRWMGAQYLGYWTIFSLKYNKCNKCKYAYAYMYFREMNLTDAYHQWRFSDIDDWGFLDLKHRTFSPRLPNRYWSDIDVWYSSATISLIIERL